MTDCILDEGRHYDAETNEWVYEVFCCNSEHKNIERCPGEHEMFRKKPRP